MAWSDTSLLLERAGTPGDVWSWMDVLVEDVLLPRLEDPQDNTSCLTVEVACAERMVADGGLLPGTQHTQGARIISEVRGLFTRRYADREFAYELCELVTFSTGRDQFLVEDFDTLERLRVSLPPTGVPLTLPLVHLFSRRPLFARDPRTSDLVAPLSALPVDRQEIMVALLFSGTHPQDALEIAHRV